MIKAPLNRMSQNSSQGDRIAEPMETSPFGMGKKTAFILSGFMTGTRRNSSGGTATNTLGVTAVCP
jgi:hypothetical protein